MRKSSGYPSLLAVAAYVLSPLPGESKASLDKRIQGKRAQVQKSKAKEGVLTKDIVGYNNRISGLQGQIRGTQKRLAWSRTTWTPPATSCSTVRDKREVARDRLVRARSELKQARGGLEDRLVELYKADQPDALTVILEADGFNDLLERTDFLERISDQDGAVIRKVRVLKARAEKAERELAGLERKRQLAAETILRRRDDIAASRDRLATAQGDLRSARNGRRTILAQVRNIRHEDEEDLEAMEAQQSKIRSQLAGGPSAGPIKKGSGRLIWPVNGTITGSFGESRPGHIHAGIDIAAPGGTPIRAADGGKVAIAGFDGRLRQLHLHPARRQHVHVLRPPVAHRRVGGPVGQPGPGHRRRGQHRALDRQPPALRGADGRQPGLDPLGYL